MNVVVLQQRIMALDFICRAGESLLLQDYILQQSPLFQGELGYLYSHTNSDHIYLSLVQSFCQTEEHSTTNQVLFQTRFVL